MYKTIASFLLTLSLSSLIVGCNDALDGSSVTSGEMEITILAPFTDGTSLGKDTVIAGDCGIASYPIEISGDVSLYTVCQSDNTWSAPVSGDGFTLGQSVNINVALRNPNYTSSSPIVTRSFVKADLACDDRANYTKMFANIDNGANGTSVPYIICTAAQLANINLYPSSNFTIGKNIDFGYARFNPITRPFTGTLDGQDFVLKNLNINATADSAVGLFKVISNATVKNLKISDATVSGNVRVGILAGDWRGAGTIQNVDVTGSVTAVQMGGGLIGLGNSSSALDISYVNTDVTVTSNDYAGGLIGYVFADNTTFNLNNSNIYANVSGKKYVGGVIGRMWETIATIDNVKHKGDINSVDQFVGGIVGEAYHGVNIANSHHIGSITVPRNSTNQDTNVGGLVGVTRALTSIDNSYVVSNITMGGDYAGGLVGRFFGGSIKISYASGCLVAIDDYYNAVNKFIGGITGNINTNSTLNNVSSHMDIDSSAEYAGGLVGFVGGAGTTINNSYAVGSLNARKNFIGGLVGQFTGTSILNSFSKVDINITNPTPLCYAGGVVGHVNNTATFNQLYYSGNIEVLNGSADNVGGVFGYVRAGSVSNVYSTGSIVGARSTVGGIAGYLRAPLNQAMSSMSIDANLKNLGGIAGLTLNNNISNAFFTGSITGDGNIGGITGWFIPSGTTVSNSYSTGALYKIAGSSSANDTFGAIIGSGSSSDVVSSYYNSLIFDQGIGANINDSNGFGQMKTLSELNQQSTYTGLDFTSDWTMPNIGFSLPSSVNPYERPVFTWMTTPNYGFQLEQIFSDDPINQTIPNVIPGVVISDSLALEFGQTHIDEITSNAQASNVTLGSFEITIEKPSVNNEIISGRMLIYGECGISGNTIEVSGAFSLRTICQANNRWAAVIDSSNLPSGNLALSVDLKNDSLGTGSPVVTKTLVKGSSLCDQSISNIGVYGNSHLGANGSTTPYILCNKGQFQNISLNPSSKFELGRDIDFSGSTTEPIAVDFTGELDGKSFALKNYTIDKPATVGVGIFKSVSNATIRDISFTNFNVNGYSQVGGFTGSWKNTGTISNVSISGILNGIQYTGGLIGVANTNSALNISNLTTSINMIGNDFTGGVIGSVNTNTGSFTASDITLNNYVLSNGATGYVGGFIGELLEPNSTITNISQTNSISSQGLNVGGLIGSMTGGSVSNCNVQGNITVLRDGTDGFIGGVIGRSTDSTTINTCSYSGTIHAGSDHVAGIIGYMKEGSITGATSSGLIEVNDERFNVPRQYIGGIIGKSEEDVATILSNLSSSMNINAKASSVGGVVGHVYGFDSRLRNSYATGNVIGETQFVGGLGGFFMGDILEDSYATGNVTVSNPTPFAYVGGLLGYSNSKTADHKRLYATGNVVVNSGTADYVAGLIGFFRGGALEDSYAEGSISGDAIRNSNGGLIGIMRGDLINSYATGDVNCTKGGNCGGLVGYLLNSNLRNSFSTGSVQALRSAGGLVGFVNNNNLELFEDNYATGIVSRKPGSSHDILKYGPVIGEELNIGSVDTVQNIFINENANVTHNTLGTGIANSISNISTSYLSFSFDSLTDDWQTPPSGFELISGTPYSLPIPDWRGGGGGGATLFNISGTLAGLQYDNLRITLNGSEELTLNPSDTTFNFTTQVLEGATYTVTISKNPESPGITCNISNGSGTANNNVSNISVVCPTFTAIDLVALNSMATGASQNLTVNATLSDSSTVNVTSYSTFSQNPVNTFSIVGNTLSASSDASATITADFLSLSSSEVITSLSGPSQLGLIGTISNVQAGEILTSIQVEVQDATGNRVVTANNSISLSLESNPSSALLGGTLTKNAVNGVVTFNDLTLDKIGEGYTLKASSGALTPSFSNSFNISAGVKASLAYINQPLGASSNALMNSFSIEVLDAGGNRVTTTESVTLSFGSDPSSGVGSLFGTLTQSTVNGVATFNNISIDFATTGYTLSANVSGLSSVTSNPFNVFAAATKLVVLSQPTNTLENNIMSVFQVALTDDFNTVITNSTATISLAFNSDPTSSANLSGVITKAAVNGVVSFDDISIDNPAVAYSLIATSTGVTSVITNNFDILIAAPSNLSLINPASSPSSLSIPTIRVDGVTSGDTIALYTNASCSGSAISSVTSSSTSVDLITSALDVGEYNIYANRLSANGLTSTCSTSFVTYEVQNIFSQNDDLTGFGNWSNVGGDNQDWSLNTGETTSNGVGPSTGSYAFTEASSPVVANDVFYLQSNVLDGATNNLRFDFNWNKRGDNMGDLFLEASNDGGSNWSEVWSHLGQDIASNGADIWRNQSIDLCGMNYNSNNVRLRFRAVMPAAGNVWNSDIGVDDLNFSATGCSGSASTISFTTPSVGTTIGFANQSAFSIGGVCSENGQNVIISGAVNSTVTCSSNTWSDTLNFSNVGDGLVSITVTHISASGQNGTTQREFFKDATTIQLDTFDSLGNWSNSASADRDWISNSGETASVNVGPSGGVNGTSYIYTEASNPVVANDQFIIESNTLDASGTNLRVEFYWNKRGSTMGNLYLEASTDNGASWNTTLWSHLGADVPTGGVSVWNKESIDICAAGVTSATTKFRFRAQMPSDGTIWNSDIGVDEVKFTSNGCSTGTPASIAINSPTIGTIITAANQNTFSVGGVCSDHGQNITFSGSVNGSTICNLGNWSYDFDLSSLPDGNVVIIADHISATSGPTGRDMATFSKDSSSSTIQVDEFNSFINWINVGDDDRDWTINVGDTGSNGVGPTTGFNGSGGYVYTEASNPVQAGDTFILESNNFDASSMNIALDFKWNKRGATMGDLFLEYTSNNGSTWNPLWSHLGVDITSGGTDVWREESIDACSLGANQSNVKFRFRAVMPTNGTIWNSDIALDNIEFKSSGCN